MSARCNGRLVWWENDEGIFVARCPVCRTTYAAPKPVPAMWCEAEAPRAAREGETTP